MERGNVTRDNAKAWALAKWSEGRIPKSLK